MLDKLLMFTLLVLFLMILLMIILLLFTNKIECSAVVTENGIATDYTFVVKIHSAVSASVSSNAIIGAITGHNHLLKKAGRKGTTKAENCPPIDEETLCSLAAVLNAASNTTWNHEAAEKKIAIILDTSCGTARRNNFKRTINYELTIIAPYANNILFVIS